MIVEVYYRFADDGMPGEVTGDGLADAFDGERFSWRVAKTGSGSQQGGAGMSPGPGPY